MENKQTEVVSASAQHTLARERTMGLSMIPLRKMRSISLAPVPDGMSLRFSSTCCMAVEEQINLNDLANHLPTALFTSFKL